MQASDDSDISLNLPTLSIIIPAIQPDAELDRCVHCIRGAFLGSEVPEIVIVTPTKFVTDTAARFPWVRVCPETRKGIYSAMNDGARASSGKYMYFLGKDDIILPGMKKAIKLLVINNPFVLFCDVYWGSSGVHRGLPSPYRILVRNVCHQGIIYSRNAFAEHGPYLRKMRIQADHLLNIKILWGRKSTELISYLREPVAWYSGDGFSMINRDPVFWKLYPIIMQKYVGRFAAFILITYRKLRRI